MHLSASRKASRLPKRFPVGTTYVVEGRAGENGQLQVFSRFVVLPGGQRINVSADVGNNIGALAPPRSSSRARKSRGRDRAKSRWVRPKKIISEAGTSRQTRR